MKKIMHIILSVMLTLILLMCLIILLYAKNSDFADFVRNNADKLPKPVADMVDSSIEQASDESTIIDASTSDVSVSEIYDNEGDDNGHHIIDIDEDWDTDGLDDNYDNDVKEVVYDESTFPEDSDELVNDKNDTQELSPRTITIDDEDEAKEIIEKTSTGNTGEELDFDKLFYPYYNMLNDRGKSLYKQIYANANDLNTEFAPVIKSTTHGELYNAMYSVIFDHPELFWLDTHIYTEFDYQGNIVKVILDFYDTFGDIKKAQNDFNNSVKGLIKDAESLGSDYDKEIYIHDLLVDKITYKEGPLDQTAYSAIVEDETVCAGYAKGMQYLLQQLGIPTYCCVGWGGGFFSGGLHAWDIVKLDSDFYNVDCTWDDQNPEIYDYFNVTDRDNYWHARLWNSRYLPSCEGTKYAYESAMENSSTNKANGSYANDDNTSSNDSSTEDVISRGVTGNVELDENGHHKIQ